MNRLIIKGKQEFMGREIKVIEGGFGENKRCITATQISNIHDIELKTINQSIKRLIDKDRMKIDIDYTDIKGNCVLPLKDLGWNGKNIANAFILSERGYSKLIKYMDDDKSWDVHDKLIDEYFTMREIINSDEQLKALALLKAVESNGEESAIAIKQYTDIRIKEVTTPLIKEINDNKPKVNVFVTRMDEINNLSITDVTKSLNLKRGQITKWAKEKGYIHKINTEVNKAGDKYFKISIHGAYRQIVITPDGLNLIHDNIEEIRNN